MIAIYIRISYPFILKIIYLLQYIFFSLLQFMIYEYNIFVTHSTDYEAYH